MEKRIDFERKEPEIVYSRSLKAGKRIYYLDVKKARNEDLYLCITESKKKTAGEDEFPVFEKHKVFLYKEDFAHFTECLNDVIGFVEQHFGGVIEERPPYVPETMAEKTNTSEVEEMVAETTAALTDDVKEEKEESKERLSFFQRLKGL